ncbi:hypothetical protein Bbelb_079680 [Branchiostoma belcheri]|nr:hypothetical protein Bbelb_079680 [Branchiostoma belcheri]
MGHQCNITAEMLKAGGYHMIQWLTQTINHVWILVKLPDDWRWGIILPFGRGRETSWYAATTGALPYCPSWASCSPVSYFQGPSLPPGAGAAHNRKASCQTALPLTIFLHYVWPLRRHGSSEEIGTSTSPLLISEQPSTQWIMPGTLWKILKLIGAPRKTITLFQQMYNSAESCVRVNGKELEWFTINSGVRQGCVAAPDLFNCVIDYLMTKVCERVPGVSFGQYNLADLEYVDDAGNSAGMTQFCRNDSMTVGYEFF